jgi:hypothetical protein
MANNKNTPKPEKGNRVKVESIYQSHYDGTIVEEEKNDQVIIKLDHEKAARPFHPKRIMRDEDE